MNIERVFRSLRILVALGATGLLTGCVNLVFSPDGKSVAFPWGDEKIGMVATVNVDGSGFRFLPGTRDKNPLAWSPDGKRLLVGPSGSNADGDLVLVNLEAGRTRKLLESVSNHAAWTDDPNRIVTVQNGDQGRPAALVWLNVDTGAETLRVNLPDANPAESQPLLWLSTSDGVAFVGSDSNVYAAVRGELIRVTTTGDVIGLGSDRLGKNLVWARKSRNPRYILLSIYSYDLNLRSVRKLPFPERIPLINPNPRSGPTEIEHVAFSPDLDEVALISYDNSKPVSNETRIYRLGIDGLNANLLKSYPNTNKAGPFGLAWSPLGGSIAVIEGTEKSASLVLHTRTGQAKALRSMTIAAKGR